MTDHEKYLVYREMFDVIPGYEERIRKYFESKDYTVYCVFLNVANEEERTYFADIEVGGSPEKYRRYYGVYSLNALERIMK